MASQDDSAGMGQQELSKESERRDQPSLNTEVLVIVMEYDTLN